MWEKISENRYKINLYKNTQSFCLEISRPNSHYTFTIRCTEFNLKTTDLKTKDFLEAQKKAETLIINKINKKILAYNECLQLLNKREEL